MSDIDQEPQTYKYESIQPYHSVLYLTYASNNEGHGRMKGENSDDQTLFSLPQNFFYTLKDKNHHFRKDLPFLSKKT